MWPTVCVSVPAELSPRTLCHLQPGRESGSPHRSTHGWAPFANTVPAHPVTRRHVHMPALLIEMQNVVCVVLLCVMFHNPLFAIPYVLSKKLTRTLSPPSPPPSELKALLFRSSSTPIQAPSWKRPTKIAQAVQDVIMPPFQQKLHTNKVQKLAISPVINWGLSVPHKSQHVHLSAPL